MRIDWGFARPLLAAVAVQTESPGTRNHVFPNDLKHVRQKGLLSPAGADLQHASDAEQSYRLFGG